MIPVDNHARGGKMKGRNRTTMEELLAKPKDLEAAVNHAIREATLMHARLGHPVATWRDGRVVWLQPQEVFDLLSANPTDANGPIR
jgi:hypothetical protein